MIPSNKLFFKETESKSHEPDDISFASPDTTKKSDGGLGLIQRTLFVKYLCRNERAK